MSGADRLRTAVEREARRVLWEAQLTADPARVAEGWERRFIADPQRVEEVMELYRQLGFEVQAEPVRPEELGPECDECELPKLMAYRTIYTRRKREEEGNGR